MVNIEEVRTFAANVSHAVRNRQTVSIGGGKFNSAELKNVVAALEQVELMRKKLEEIVDVLKSHPDRERGNSTVHYSYHAAVSGLAAFSPVASAHQRDVEGSSASDVCYIQVKDSLSLQWLMNPDTQMKSVRPEDAKEFTSKEANDLVKHLTKLGFTGLTVVSELPSSDQEASPVVDRPRG